MIKPIKAFAIICAESNLFPVNPGRGYRLLGLDEKLDEKCQSTSGIILWGSDKTRWAPVSVFIGWTVRQYLENQQRACLGTHEDIDGAAYLVFAFRRPI